jgi:3-dehydroquinate synthase
MGTGKTVVGREAAARLGRRFVDLDDLIVERAGKSIPDIFAQDGEPVFRRLEAALCQELRAPAGLVVATGGGAVLNPANREALDAGGIVICLEAGLETISARLAGQAQNRGAADHACPERSPERSRRACPERSRRGDLVHERPLLAGPDPRDRLAALLAQRREVYATLPRRLDTSGLSVEAAAERVLGIAAGLPDGGCRIPIAWPLADTPGARGQGPGVRGGGADAEQRGAGAAFGHDHAAGYDVLIAPGLLAQAGQRISAAGLRPGRCAVATNPTVGGYHAGALLASLRQAGFEPVVFELPDGETHKTLETVAGLYDRLAAARLARDEPVIALGGGVIGDMAGFVAATWLRGVPFVQIPTSLLAMVDASVGGKVAVDLPAGKNLVGAFKQPAVVLIDPALLATLPAAEFRSGMAEVLKAGLIGDAELFAACQEDIASLPLAPDKSTLMIAAAVRVKARIVERDPFETGDRAWLNLGHTFGHALELISGYTLRHGEAVGLGMIAAAELSATLGCCAAGLPQCVRDAVGRLGLPVRHAFDPAAALAAMATDKKRRGRSSRFVIPRRIGEVSVMEGVAAAAVRAALAGIAAHEPDRLL